MRHYLKIENYTVPRVSKLDVAGFYRSEERKTTFSGGLAVDRGQYKKKISARIRIFSADEKRALEALLQKIIVKAEFYDNGEIVQKDMISAPIKSFQSCFPSRSEENAVYTDVVLELEEQ